MAKKKKNRVRNLDKSGPSEGSEGQWFDPVRFELEENAEEMFRQAVEKLSPQAIQDKKSGEWEEDRRGKSRAKDGISSVDLHGKTLGEAQAKVVRTIQSLLANRSDGFSLRIVTGKGIHSGPGGGVLAREIHEFVRLRFARDIESMTDSPADIALSGVPLRGYFDVRFRVRARRG